MRLYVAGPMTGYENNNFPAFELATRKLRAREFDVVSPHEIIVEVNASEYGDDYDKCCREDIKAMMECDEVVTLNGWEKSRGARTEVAVAILLGIAVSPIYVYLPEMRHYES